MRYRFFVLFLFSIVILLSGCESNKGAIEVKDSDIQRAKVEQPPAPKSALLPSFFDPSSTVKLRSQYNGVVLHTNYGDITIAFYVQDAPYTVENFLYLAQQGFYDGV